MLAAEFFAGIGIVRLALEEAGWEVVFANDIDSKKRTMYSDHFGPEHFRLDDIHQLSGPDIPTVSLATASFPCIDLSLAGNRAGLNGKHSSSYWEFLRIVAEMKSRKPPFVVLENVHGLLSSKQGEDLNEIVRSLNQLGYACDLLSVDASWFVPQSRPRLFIVGRPWQLGDTLPLISPHPARPRAIVEFVLSHPRLQWHFAKLPPIRVRQQRLKSIIERVPPSSPLWWDSERTGHLFSQMSDSHKRKLKLLSQSSISQYATVYKRVRPAGCRAELRFDGIAGCLRTPRGGSSKQFVIQAGKGDWKVRNLTSREYARLQGVPDDYPINVDENHALFGFGDAVCVPAVSWVIKHCVNPYLSKRGRFDKELASKSR
jgi:DNA (cytosine-5)-methyltransferase 1